MRSQDLTANLAGFVFAWGAPGAVLVGATLLDHPVKTLVWAAVLTWMGVACLVNARRCRRTHCLFTRPFFLLGAVLSTLHGFEVLSLGAQGWRWLELTIALGAAALWIGSESVFGRYWPRGATPGVDR